MNNPKSIITMKKIFYLGIICIIGFNSCIVEDNLYINYILTNKSSHQVKIEVYSLGALAKIQYLEINQVYKTLHDEGGYFSTAPPFAISQLDSAVIIFDDNYVLSYTCKAYKNSEGCIKAKNILNSGYYNFVKTSEYNHNYYYDITDEDYANAVKID